MRSSSNTGRKGRSPNSSQTKVQERNLGNSTGRLTVVGLGPGSPELLAPAAREAIREARVIVGYKGYIGLVEEGLLQGKEVIFTGMRGEVERCLRAIEKAQQGLDTVVVSSGDPGIYGMAGLVLELIEKEGLQDQIEIEVIPGIPALSAAAALLGAPLMHDFSVVSLSDLLTPWELIIKRVRAALEADFVLVIYNPKSKRRTWQLQEVLKEVEKSRGSAVPVGIVRNAAREGQKVAVVRTGDVDLDSIDMLTILIIGNSRTRVIGSKMVTPRGYMEKYPHKQGSMK